MLQTLLATIFAIVSFFASALGLNHVPLPSGNTSSDYTVTPPSSSGSSFQPPSIDLQGRNFLTALPSTAREATAEEVTDFFAQNWLPQPAYQGNTISFERVQGAQLPEGVDAAYGFVVKAPGTCNGVGTLLIPADGGPSLRNIALPTTEMACEGLGYEMGLTEALSNAQRLYADTANARTFYLAGPKGALTLVQAN